MASAITTNLVSFLGCSILFERCRERRNRFALASAADAQTGLLANRCLLQIGYGPLGRIVDEFLLSTALVTGPIDSLVETLAQSTRPKLGGGRHRRKPPVDRATTVPMKTSDLEQHTCNVRVLP